MELTPFTIYLWQLADGIVGLCCTMALILIICGGTLFFLASMEDCKPVRKIAKRSVLIGVVLALTGTLFPSSKAIALMYVLPKIAESEVIKKDAPEMYEMVKKTLRDCIEIQ